MIRDVLQQVSGERIRRDLFYLCRDPLPFRKVNYTRPGQSVNSLAEADVFIRGQLESAGYGVTTTTYRVQPFRCDSTKPLHHWYSAPEPSDPTFDAANLEATRPGCTRPEEIIQLIAHKDSMSWIDSPGAHDNAVGTVANLELARVLATCTLHRSVRLLFCNEEHTPWTSVTAAKNIKEAGLDVLALINLDAVGGKSADKSGRLINVTRFTTPEGERLADLNKRLNDRFSIGLEQSKYRSEDPGDDDGSFIKAGFPWAVLNIGSMPYSDPNYHLETDTPEKVDYDTAEKVVSLTLALILHLDLNGRP